MALEAYNQKIRVKIRYYLPGNGRFQENALMKSFKDYRQKIFFCGVNDHFKNKKA